MTRQWCNQRADSFKYYTPLKGGWEAWVQADLSAFILSNDSRYDILREQSIYNTAGQRVDWLFNDNGTVPEKIAVELKCQSFENYRAFNRGIDDDIAKLAQNRLKRTYRGCQTAVMGICFEQDARDYMLNLGFMEIYRSGEVSCCIMAPVVQNF